MQLVSGWVAGLMAVTLVAIAPPPGNNDGAESLTERLKRLQPNAGAGRNNIKEIIEQRQKRQKAASGAAARNAPTPTSSASATAPAPAPAKTSSVEEADVIDIRARARKGRFSFEFSKADIEDVVKAISNLTRRNFIIPEKIKSQKITILSPTKVTAAEAYQVFLSALEINGITIVRAGKFYKLVQAKESKKMPIPTCVGPDDECPKYSDQMVTVLFQLQHVEANQVNGVIKSLVGKDGEVTIFAPSNAMIISEYAPNLTRLRKIVAALDVPGFDDELRLVQVEYATASEIADTLTQIFEIQSGGTTNTTRPRNNRRGNRPNTNPIANAVNSANASGGDESEVQISKIIADDRTNQLIIKANRRSFDSIRLMIGKLDVPIDEAESGRVHVHYLTNAKAEDLAATLSSLAEGGSRGGARSGGGTNRANNRRRNNNNNNQRNNGARSGPTSAQLFEDEVRITADSDTNSLVIVANARDYRSLQRIVEKLDRPRRQVYVESAILEVSVNNDNQLGVNWHTPVRLSEDDIGSGLGGGNTVGFIQRPPDNSSPSPTLGALATPAGLLGVAGGSVAGIVGKGITVPVGDDELTIPSFGVILRALQSTSNARILSTPHILTTDNEEATIEVGERRPFQRGTSIPAGVNLGAAAGAAGAGGNALAGLGALGNVFSAIDRIDLSLRLQLTPQINELGKIRLEIDQQIEDFVGLDGVTQQPITANRSAQTTVVVDDQQTVVIGGLIRDRTTASESKIPLLGDLPLLGFLFRQRGTITEKVNLLLILTPYIIDSNEDFQRIFQRKLEEHEEFAALYYGHTQEFRAYIDYAKKSGPLARLVQKVRKERARYENGGNGSDGEILIQPGEDEAIPVPHEFRPAFEPESPPPSVTPEEESKESPERYDGEYDS